MTTRTLIVEFALASTLGTAIGFTQTGAPATVDGLVSAAKNSAGLEWPGTFLRLCVVPPAAGGRGTVPAAAAGGRGGAQPEAASGPPKAT